MSISEILVFGHLYVDSLVESPSESAVTVQVGGTGFNAARAFKEQGFEPILIGRVGVDPEANLVRQALAELGIRALLGEDRSRPTGRCRILLNHAAHSPDRFAVNPGNANHFDGKFFAESLSSEEAASADLGFVAFNLLRQVAAGKAASFLDLVRRGGRTLILDLVPHKIYETRDIADLKTALGPAVDVLISELRTLMRFLDPRFDRAEPRAEDWEALFSHFPAAVPHASSEAAGSTAA
jgi:sugar/nucleoside kinase (ribokinase family)